MQQTGRDRQTEADEDATTPLVHEANGNSTTGDNEALATAQQQQQSPSLLGSVRQRAYWWFFAIGLGRFLSYMGWHPECFRCASCNSPITGSEFVVSVNRLYHKNCYKELFHPRCEVCKQFIPPNRSGLVEYRVHPFWGQRYCLSHEVDNTPRCCSCERLEPRDVEYAKLDDGRELCLECMDSALLDRSEGQPLYQEILDFYEGMGIKIPKQILVLLVGRQALHDERDEDERETWSLTFSEEPSIRRPRNPFGEIEAMRLTRECEVTAILVLYGLPRLLTGSILAHELMQAWLHLNGYPSNLNPTVEGGICQVMAHTWFISQIGSSSSSFNSGPSRLREFVMHQLIASPIYGEGFRIGRQAVVKYGLQRTLNHIKVTGQFPV